MGDSQSDSTGVAGLAALVILLASPGYVGRSEKVWWQRRRVAALIYECVGSEGADDA